ncbi:MAG: bifunctional phosphopantothenoylcysteine decarboxylase/phosphopantothenate--cysteine ligase CoaBC [Pseudomonadota bacterium]
MSSSQQNSILPSGPLKGRNVLVGVCGGIAAYKTPELVRRLKDQAAEVRVVMTQAAKAFITPLTLQAVSGHRVHDRLLDAAAEAGMGHIELARWADEVLIAPATADIMAKLANGHADDLLTTLVLATRARIWLAPAMNQAMWAHPAVAENSDRLQYRGVNLLGPDAGSQACGDEGYGRMQSPDDLVATLVQAQAKHEQTQTARPLAGKTFVVTAGPTFEDIDPVRFIGNRSSGRLGFAVATALQQAGAAVRLISGPVALATPQGVHRVDVRAALEMRDAVLAALPADGFIAVAAVADYRPAERKAVKIKKSDKAKKLKLIPNPDILTEVSAIQPRPFLVGFAAETEQLHEYAQAKLSAKKLDLIAANRVGDGLGFDSERNALEVFSAQQQWSLSAKHKSRLAEELVAVITEQMM